MRISAGWSWSRSPLGFVATDLKNFLKIADTKAVFDGSSVIKMEGFGSALSDIKRKGTDITFDNI